jgi:hypothetical protein
VSNSLDDDAMVLHRQLDEERRAMREMLLRIAAYRETDEDAHIDVRYARAAGNLRHLATTMADVPDDLFMQVATLHTRVGDLVGQLISARLLAIHFEIAPYASATEFYHSLIDVGRDGSSRHRLN